MIRSPSYSEFSAPEDLAEVVECCWISRGRPVEPDGLQTRVLPDGCMDLLFDLGASRALAGEPEGRDRAVIVGTMTAARLFRFRGGVEMVGVRFRPGGIRSFVPVAPAELVDGFAPLRAVWGSEVELLLERLHECPSDRLCAELLFGRLRSHRCAGAPLDSLVASVVRRLREAGGTLPVAELASALGVSTRTLQRRVRREVGISPKLLARVVRMQATVGSLLASSGVPLIGRAALAAGYFDQSHLNREFRELVGISPGEWLAERAG